MGKVKIPYYVVKRGQGFWQPTRSMRVLGFRSVPCGKDGPSAWALAEDWNRRWQATRSGQAPSPAMASADNLSPDKAEELTVYPRGSLGEAFRRYRRTQEWAGKAPRTREDWWRGWKRIKPLFGDCALHTVTLEVLSDWRKAIEDAVSLQEAHRCMKIWRALWKVSAAMGYCERDADPSLAVRNRSAEARSDRWAEGEAVRLYKRAWRAGYHGLAAVIAVSWSTMLSPVDVRTLRASQLIKDAEGDIFFTHRGKTDAPVGGAISKRAMAALVAYAKQLGIEMHGEAFIFRNRSGDPYSKDTLSHDFADVRALEFGEGERRRLADFRRSGAIEAIAGGAKAEHLAHAMGNTLATSTALFATYVPVNFASLAAVEIARRQGRRKVKK